MILLVGVADLASLHSVSLYPSFSLTAYGAGMCQSTIFHFTVSSAYRGGHLTQFWMMGCKTESVEDFWATFGFPDTDTTPLLLPSSYLECNWELVLEQLSEAWKFKRIKSQT